MGATRVVFHSVDNNGDAIYHTNVMMAVGDDFVVICMDSILDAEEKEEVLSSFEKTGKKVITISQNQVEEFAGNMLQVRNLDDETYLVMSQTAFRSLTEKQKEQLSEFTTLLPIAIPTIEQYGGGSVRCMMAEVFLPKK